MTEQDGSREREPYEAPTIAVLGTVEEVTRGAIGLGGDTIALLTA